MEADNFGTRIKRLRQQHNLSQARLATLTNVSKVSVWSWECRRVVPRSRTVKAVADVFGVTERYLLTGFENDRSEKTLESSVADGSHSVLEAILADCKARISEELHIDPGNVSITLNF